MIEVLTVATEDVEQTWALGALLSAILTPGDVVALDGELGAGKTQITRGIVKGLGLDIRLVSSPTYVLMQEYIGESITVLHLDAYRLKSEDELETIGWNEETREGTISIVEWSERINGKLNSDRLAIDIEHVSESGRSIQLSGHGAFAEKVKSLEPMLIDAGYRISAGSTG